jgi:hypothetical protein
MSGRGSKEVLAENYGPGLPDWLNDQVTVDASRAKVIQMLQEYAAEHGFPLPDARGLSLSAAFEDLVNWFRNRRLVADDGIHRGSFRWFAFHVPPRGKGSLTWSRSEKRADGITLKVFGAGWGGTASIKLSKTVELSDCVNCHDIVQHLEVRIRRYCVETESGGSVEETTVDPVRWLHREPRERKNCCGQQIKELDPFEFEILESEAIDARKTSARLKIDRVLELASGMNSSLKLELPGRALEAGLELKSEGSLSCKTHLEFAAGALYMPYVRLRHRGFPPQWGSADG